MIKQPWHEADHYLYLVPNGSAIPQ